MFRCALVVLLCLVRLCELSNVRIQPDFLRSGDSTFFIVPIHEKSQSVFVVDYTLIAESDEYAVVPEFPLGSGALLIASVSSYIILSRNPEKVINTISKISHFKR